MHNTSVLYTGFDDYCYILTYLYAEKVVTHTINDEATMKKTVQDDHNVMLEEFLTLLLMMTLNHITCYLIPLHWK